MNAQAERLNRFADVMGMVHTKNFIINHVAHNNKAAFGQALEDDTRCYISPTFIKRYKLSEGMLIKARVVSNKYEGKQNIVTEWKVASIVDAVFLEDEITEVGGYEPEPEPEVEPEVPLEDRIYEVFEEHPEDCFTTREVCERVLDTDGVNIEVRDVIRRLHALGDICQLRIKTKASNKRGTVLWGLNISSFGFNDVEETEDEEVEVYESGL